MQNMLNLLQFNEIQRGLDAGMSPDEISDSIARINDLSEFDVAEIRAAAVGLQRCRLHGMSDAAGPLVSKTPSHPRLTVVG